MQQHLALPHRQCWQCLGSLDARVSGICRVYVVLLHVLSCNCMLARRGQHIAGVGAEGQWLMGASNQRNASAGSNNMTKRTRCPCVGFAALWGIHNITAAVSLPCTNSLVCRCICGCQPQPVHTAVSMHWADILDVYFKKLLCLAVSLAVIGTYAAELFPTAIRATAMGKLNQASRIGSITAPCMLLAGAALPATSHGPLFLPLLVFGALSLLTCVLVLLVLPETHGLPMPECAQVWTLGLSSGCCAAGAASCHIGCCYSWIALSRFHS